GQSAGAAPRPPPGPAAGESLRSPCARSVRAARSILAQGCPEAVRVEAGDVVLGLLARPAHDNGLSLLVYLEHELRGLREAVAEELLEHERHVGHEIDRVVPDHHDPRPVVRLLLAVTGLLQLADAGRLSGLAHSCIVAQPGLALRGRRRLS